MEAVKRRNNNTKYSKFTKDLFASKVGSNLHFDVKMIYQVDNIH